MLLLKNKICYGNEVTTILGLACIDTLSGLDAHLWPVFQLIPNLTELSINLGELLAV